MNILPLIFVPTSQQITVSAPAYETRRTFNWVSLSWLFIGLGIALRLFHFFVNRSLWGDELYLNVNTIQMDFLDFATHPMAYEQKAPLGYLWMTKLCVLLFGTGEKALRLFSLLCGIGTLFVFKSVAQHFLKPWTVVLAVGIMALGIPFIYHAVEAKQYSTELFASVLALYFYIKFNSSIGLNSNFNSSVGFISLLRWGILGSILLFFSYSVIFMLAGIAIVVSINLLLKRDWETLLLNLIPFTMWLISFGLVYIFFLSKYEESGWLKNFFEVVHDAYMPLPPTSLKDMAWFIRTPYFLLEHPLGMLLTYKEYWWSGYNAFEAIFRLPFLPVACVVMGILALFRKSKYLFALLILPIMLVLVASGLEQYPFYERLILFLAPLFILIVGFGAERIAAIFPANKKLSGILVALLLAPLVWNAGYAAVNRNKVFYKTEFNREALLYINDRYQEGDAVYVYWNMLHAYQYYKPAYNLKYDAITGEDFKNEANNKEDYYNKVAAQIGDLSGKKRIWIISSPNLRYNIGDYINRKPAWYHEKDFSPTKALEQKIISLGATPIGSIPTSDVNVKLYDLSGVDSKSKRTQRASDL